MGEDIVQRQDSGHQLCARGEGELSGDIVGGGALLCSGCAVGDASGGSGGGVSEFLPHTVMNPTGEGKLPTRRTFHFPNPGSH